MKVINGENLILGRAGSVIVKQAVLGEEVAIVNCEKIVLTGNKKSIMERQVMLSKMKGRTHSGIFYQRRPDYFVRKILRHMLPKNTKGKEAYKKIKCHIGIPEGMQEKMTTIDHAHVRKVPHLKHVSVEYICKTMGGKWLQK